MNSSNSHAVSKDQAITSSVGDALRLGCSAVGFTIYPGADQQFEMIEEIREITEEARAFGLAVVIWSYPRGGDLSKEGETAIDVTAYAAHMAAQLGANIIKVKPPTDFIESPDAQKVYDAEKIDISSLNKRIAHIMEASFGGRRLVVFSGGAAKGTDAIYDEIRQLRDGGANGSIIGRNSFQRSREGCARPARKRHQDLPGQVLIASASQAGASNDQRCRLYLISPSNLDGERLDAFTQALDDALSAGTWPVCNSGSRTPTRHPRRTMPSDGQRQPCCRSPSVMTWPSS